MLDGLEQVVGLVRDLEVGVARHAEDGALDDLHAREELGEEVRDHLARAGRSAPRVPKRHEARQTFRHLDPREALLARRAGRARARRALSESREMYGNGCPGPTPSGVQDGEDLAREPLARAPSGSSPERSSTEPIEIPASASAGRSFVAPQLRLARRRARRHARGSPRAPRAASCRRPSARRGPTTPGPMSPATRTMKNSSRFAETMRADTAPARAAGSAGRRRARARGALNSSRRELAVEEAACRLRLRLACRRHRLIFVADRLPGGYALVSIW